MAQNKPNSSFCGRTRREFLWQTGGGFGAVALSGLLGSNWMTSKAAASGSAGGYVNPLAPKPPPLPGKAKSVIFLFMYGGPSQVDTFDYKPALYPLDGKTIAVNTFGRGGRRNESRVVGPKWDFKQYGQCGKYVSDLFPNIGECVDDIAFLHSMYADSPLHGSALLMMNCGRILSGHPSLGSWVNYGLGTENQNLPGYVVMLDEHGGPISGAKNWTSGYMPATYQGVVMRSQGSPILDLQPPEGVSRELQRDMIDHLNAQNAQHAVTRADNSNLAARIESFELAYRMQAEAPEAVDFASEDEKIKELYGMDQSETQTFGKKCLLARRLVERGVRFVQIYAGGAHNGLNWDAHGDLVENHGFHAKATDKPIAGLLKDLKQRGMLDETLVVWGGEFGRQPTAEYAEGTGRDHNSYGFTMWMAGGGIKGGVSVGETDELGAEAVVDRFHVKNLHATILHQLGFGSDTLTYLHNGLDDSLVGVEGAEPIHQIIA